MSSELTAEFATGNQLYSNLVGPIPAPTRWNAVSGALENYLSADYPDYFISMGEQGSSGLYLGDFPASLSTAGEYRVIVYQMQGASPAEGDPIVDRTNVVWNGFEVVPDVPVPSTVPSMGRYVSVDQIKDFLVGSDILTKGLEYTDMMIENAIANAEDEIDMMGGNQAFQFRRFVDVLDGRGRWSIVCKNTPILSLQAATIVYLPYATQATLKDGDGNILIDRKIGKISIAPTARILTQSPTQIFAEGSNNITVDGYAGWCFAGNNFDAIQLRSLGFYDWMLVSTDSNYAYFSLPRSIGVPKSLPTDLNSLASIKMFKGQSPIVMTDDSANWSPVNSRQVKCPIASYDSSQLYRLAYVPHGIVSSAIKLTVCNLLAQKGNRDDFLGSGGAANRNVSGFSESYEGGTMYGGLIKQYRAEVKDIMKMFRKVAVAI